MKTKFGIVAVAILLIGVLSTMVMPVSAGSSSQKVEYEQGTYERVYPFLTLPNPGECGSDSDDLILQYNTYWGPRVNPDNVRWNSDLWWVKYWVRTMYPSGLSANGLSTTTTRVCVGTRGQVMGTDLELLYLWHK